MKFGQVEGSPEEIKNFIQDNGLKASDFFIRPESPIKPIWFFGPVIIVLITLVILTLFTPQSAGGVTLVFLVGCCASAWLAVMVQLRYSNAVATWIVVTACFLILLVALGVVAPREMLDIIKDRAQ